MIDNKSVIKQFINLAKIAGSSRAEAAVVAYISKQLKQLDLEHFQDNSAEKIGGNAGNVLCKIPGNNNQAIPILFAAHLDTVQPCHKVAPRETDGESSPAMDKRFLELMIVPV